MMNNVGALKKTVKSVTLCFLSRLTVGGTVKRGDKRQMVTVVLWGFGA